jgi:hypothetical protein
MGRQVESRTIDGRLYEFYQVSPKIALKVLTRVTKLLGEPLGILGGQLAGSKKDGIAALLEQDTSELLPKAVSLFVTRLDETEVQQVIDWLLEPVHVQTEDDKGTRRIMFERDFQGRIGHLMKVVLAALEVNFQDFFSENSGLGAIFQRAKTDMTSAKQI